MLWAMRCARLLAVVFVFLVARYFLLKLLAPFPPDLNIQPTLIWMEAHPDLSGWAQFVGAMAAIFLAIAIPAWQRHGQNLDRWRSAEDLNAALALHSYFLLSEVHIYLNGYLGTSNMPRELARKDWETNDLLQRIHALEIRENDAARITRLFHARGYIHQTTMAMASPFLQKALLSDVEKNLIRGRLDDLNKNIKEAEAASNKAADARAQANLWLLPRFFYSIIRFIHRGKLLPS